jgi:hypothetical protein
MNKRKVSIEDMTAKPLKTRITMSDAVDSSYAIDSNFKEEFSGSVVLKAHANHADLPCSGTAR